MNLGGENVAKVAPMQTRSQGNAAAAAIAIWQLTRRPW